MTANEENATEQGMTVLLKLKETTGWAEKNARLQREWDLICLFRSELINLHRVELV